MNSRVNNQLKETPLHLAIKTENETVIRHLLDGANVNIVDGCRRAPLHLAVSRNLPHIVEALLDHGASVNIQVMFLNTSATRVVYTCVWESYLG